jgi:hypothetical protein
MTIPIRPGPFSFLAGAGQAAGSIGEALIAKRERERQQALQNAGLLMQLITGPNAIADPTSLAPQLVSSLSRLGVQNVTPQSIVANPTIEKNKAIAGMTGPQKQIAQGLPTTADVSVNTAQGKEAETTISALEGLSYDQILALRKIPSKDAAEIADKLFIEKSRTDLMGQDKNRLENNVQADIMRGVLKRLPNDAQFQRIAHFAAVGGLGYLTAQLQESGAYARMGSALNQEKLRAVTTVTTQAGSAYRQELNDWTEKKQAAINMAALSSGEDQGSKEYTAVIDAAEKDYEKRFPKPSLDKFLDAGLEQYGLTKEDYQTAFRSLVHASSGGGPTASTGTRSRVSDAQFNQIKALYQQGRFTDADVDAAESLSPDQKKQIKAGKRTP